MPQEINWSTLQPQSGAVGGGSRHPSQAPTPALVTWACPKCSAQNQGPLEAGCAACGAGKPGYRAETAAPPSQQQGRVLPDPFALWFKHAHPEGTDTATYEAMRKAFLAGMDYAMRAGTPVTLPGFAEQRTLAAALAYFIEQVLLNQPEEIASGEWLDVEAAQALLKRLEIPNA
jgi:hypothetical protein